MASPGDIARWLFWVQLRKLLPVEHPYLVRSALPLWRLPYFSSRTRALMEDEYRRCGLPASQQVIRDTYRVAFRAHYEELLLGRLTSQNLGSYVEWDGREHLDAALARGKGAILLFPHAGHVMMIIAATSLNGYRYTQYAARGLAPPEVAAAHPEVFGHNRWREEVRAVRESDEDKLPARYLTLSAPPRELFRTLNRNELVGIAFDGRIGRKFIRVPYLGREALLNPGPYRLAVDTGAAIVPTFVECPAQGRNRLVTRPAIIPNGQTPKELCLSFLQSHVEPWLTKHPEHYGVWLVHCRMRNTVDDHPFFVDQAEDDRWKKWAK